MKKKIEETQEELVRLNKFLSHNSNYSRREADKLIEELFMKERLSYLL